MECSWSGKELGIIPYLPQTNSNTGIPAGPLSSASIPTFTAELQRCQVLEKQHIAMVACQGVEIPPGYMLYLALSQHLGNSPPQLRTPRDPKHPSNGKMRREVVESQISVGNGQRSGLCVFKPFVAATSSGEDQIPLIPAERPPPRPRLHPGDPMSF